MISFKAFVDESCDLQEGRLHKSAITGLAMRVKAEGTKAEQQVMLAKRLLQQIDKKSEIDFLKTSHASDVHILNAMRPHTLLKFSLHTMDSVTSNIFEFAGSCGQLVLNASINFIIKT